MGPVTSAVCPLRGSALQARPQPMQVGGDAPVYLASDETKALHDHA